MKKYIFAALTFLVMMFCSVIAVANPLYVALSPHQDQASNMRRISVALKAITEANGGDSAIFIDGFNLKSICMFTNPVGKLYENPKARLASNGKCLGALKKFVQSNDGTGGAVRLPQLLSHIVDTYSVEKGANVIVLASPLYDDDAETAYSMRNGRFPSDGHLNASRAVSPFGIEGGEKRLNDLRVHIGYGDENIMTSSQYKHFLNRFWSLHIEGQGGKLVTFSADTAALFQRVTTEASAPAHNYSLSADAKLEMIRLRPKTTDKSIFEYDLSASPLSLQRLRSANDVQIGLSWDCNDCDLDVYAQPWPGAEVLYFGHISSPQGNHWKDFQKSPRGTNGHETISFSVPIDLRELTIAINFYAGQAPKGVNGELRIAAEGKVYAAPFKIVATMGDLPTEMPQAFATGKSPNQRIVIIDPIAVISRQ